MHLVDGETLEQLGDGRNVHFEGILGLLVALLNERLLDIAMRRNLRSVGRPNDNLIRREVQLDQPEDDSPNERDVAVLELRLGRPKGLNCAVGIGEHDGARVTGTAQNAMILGKVLELQTLVERGYVAAEELMLEAYLCHQRTNERAKRQLQLVPRAQRVQQSVVLYG